MIYKLATILAVLFSIQWTIHVFIYIHFWFILHVILHVLQWWHFFSVMLNLCQPRATLRLQKTSRSQNFRYRALTTGAGEGSMQFQNLLTLYSCKWSGDGHFFIEICENPYVLGSRIICRRGLFTVGLPFCRHSYLL